MTAHIKLGNHIKRGFTLIELLIVMAILGVLAVVVLVAINPAEQLARTRDTGRVSAVTQIGHAVSAYYTSKSSYPTAGATWADVLVTSGEIGSVPAAIAATGYTACSTSAENGWCYATGATDTIIYTKLESKQYESKCTTPATDTAWFLFSVTQGKGGTLCSTGAEPAAAASYSFL